MTIGLIAMSGVRAASEELMRAGLTMPAVVERGRVVASMPTLALLTLAALTPDDVEVEYYEIHDLRKQPQLPDRYDLVAIATQSAQVKDAYRVADEYRARGTKVVMGGLHVTACPEEASAHCDAVAIGEGELLWPRIVADFRANRLQRVYQPLPGVRFNLADAPVPRFDLLDIDRYNRVPIQTSRGCPHLCDFCASSVLLTSKYAVKPVANVLRELDAVQRVWRHPFIEFADDNSFASRSHAKALLRKLCDRDVKWFTESDISIADDPELLDLLRESGCRQVLIGLESPSTHGLHHLEIKSDWKRQRRGGYEDAIHAIQSRGVTVNGCFILGLDGDNERTFDAIYDFVDRTSLFEVQITVLTPFPGTPLYARLLREGRMLEPGAWEKCTLFDVNFKPKHMSPQRLQRGLLELAERLYDPAFIQARRERFFEELHRSARRSGRGLAPEWAATAGRAAAG